jgi:uncharacterized membrane protein
LSLPSQNLSNYDVIILNDVPEISEKQVEMLRDTVREGKGLIWFGGDSLKSDVWNQRSALKSGALLPAVITGLEKVSDELGAGRPLDPILPKHPICQPLESLPKDLLSETQFHKIYRLKPLPVATTVLNLSGSATPLLVEQSLGRGHIFMFASSSAPRWNNMALTPVFPMLMQQMITYLTGRKFETSTLVGGSLSLSYPTRPEANDGVFESPSGEIISVPVREHAGEYVAFLNHAKEAGFYTARVSLQSPGRPIAVNVDTRESNVRCAPIDEVQASLVETGVKVTENPSPITEGRREGQEYWRAFLIACLTLLILDSMMAAKVFGKLGKKKAPISQEREGEAV